MIRQTIPSTFDFKMTAYIPHVPTPKQISGLILPHQEVFYGGAPGGGKSDWILMGALQYADVPKYSALILRKTIADANKPSSIMYRAREWLSMTDAVFDGKNNAWLFPSGAILTFGRLSDIGDAFKYQSAEYQYIGADEITQLNPIDLDYVVNTRLRRTKCPDHKSNPNPLCSTCLEYAPLSKVPLRIRTASNPGGQYHSQVRDRYQIKKIPGRLTPSGHQLYAGTHPTRPHIPAFIEDNPYLDAEEYLKTLKELQDPVTAAQLISGNWGISAEGRFKIGWLKRYEEVL